ncbi:MAG: ribbon-helix-helix protein, CopG family [Deltaproteobacteria bacterium]|nr:ribbon-helix-helix protein, CopG family [Deltaproteobacteria bacterium]
MATQIAQTKKRINIELPGIIIEKLDNLARSVHSSRAELIRRLISERLVEKENEEMERAMKEGYMANYGFIKESGEEWDFTLGDGI